MGSILGFVVTCGLPPEEAAKTHLAKEYALAQFHHLEKQSLQIGRSMLHIWGHTPLSDCIHTLPDGSILILIGSPHNKVPWSEVERNLLNTQYPKDFQLLWEGRTILLKIDKDGNG